MIKKQDILEIDSVFLELNNQKIFQSVYLKFQVGKVIGLIGANSSGKTLLFETIFGIDKRADTTIRLNGDCVSNLYHQKKLINFLPEKSFVPGFLTLKCVFDLFQINFIELVNLFPEFRGLEYQKMQTFSFGQKRLIETFLIIQSETLFSMLDLPFSYIMPKHVDTIIDLIKLQTVQKGFLICDHLHDKLLPACDHTYLLKNGNINLIDNTTDLKNIKILL